MSIFSLSDLKDAFTVGEIAITAAVGGLVLYLRTKFAGKETVAEHAAAATLLAQRVSTLETKMEALATRADIAPIFAALERLGGDIRTVDAKVVGVQHVMARMANQSDIMLQAGLKE